MSESKPDDVELLLLEVVVLGLASASLTVLTGLFFCRRADDLGLGLLNNDPVCGSRSALRVDSNGFVR